MSERFESRRVRGSAPRCGLIDAIRGFAVVNMILCHLLYDLFCVYSLRPGYSGEPAVILWELSIGCTFIIISGVSIHFSRHGYRRGLIVLCGALVVTLLTMFFIPSEIIWFGVLNFLGCAILITFALRKALMRIDARWGAGTCLLLFAVMFGLPDGYLGFFGLRIISLPEALYQSPYLAFFGLPSKGFHSADYYPLVPWLFLYFFGFFLWVIIKEKGWDAYFRRRIPVLSVIGRYSFVIYMLHQPLLFGMFYLIFGSF